MRDLEEDLRKTRSESLLALWCLIVSQRLLRTIYIAMLSSAMRVV